MSDKSEFQVGDDVVPRSGFRGSVIEVRETTEGKRIVGIMSVNGNIEYHLEAAVRSAEGMH